MEFIKKKTLEVQLKKAGLDSVTKHFTGSSGSKDPSPLSDFSGRGADERDEESPAEDEIFPVAAACVFDKKPKNFPPLLYLCYIDRSILSDDAAAPVKWAFRVFYAFVSLLCLNTAVAISFVVLRKGKDWVHLVLSVVFTILLAFYELFSYETAFRGAYRTSTNLRKRYLFFSTANIVITSLYTFLGVAFFNGWARIPNIGNATDEHASVRKVLTVLEALGWTFLLFLNTYTLFDFYHLYKGRDQGLSPSALGTATNQTQVEREEPELQRSRRNDIDRARIQEIRGRYGIP